jgi:hypothetical protein
MCILWAREWNASPLVTFCNQLKCKTNMDHHLPATNLDGSAVALPLRRVASNFDRHIKLLA